MSQVALDPPRASVVVSTTTAAIGCPGLRCADTDEALTSPFDVLLGAQLTDRAANDLHARVEFDTQVGV